MSPFLVGKLGCGVQQAKTLMCRTFNANLGGNLGRNLGRKHRRLSTQVPKYSRAHGVANMGPGPFGPAWSSL
jgi:hypothetical protein